MLNVVVDVVAVVNVVDVVTKVIVVVVVKAVAVVVKAVVVASGKTAVAFLGAESAFVVAASVGNADVIVVGKETLLDHVIRGLKRHEVGRGGSLLQTCIHLHPCPPQTLQHCLRPHLPRLWGWWRLLRSDGDEMMMVMK